MDTNNPNSKVSLTQIVIILLLCIFAPIMTYYFFKVFWLIAYAILLGLLFVIKALEKDDLEFEKYCFLSPKTSGLMFKLKPISTQLSSAELLPLGTKSVEEVGFKKNKEKTAANRRFRNITGYIVFEDGTWAETTEEKSLEDLKNSSSKEIYCYVIATTNFRRKKTSKVKVTVRLRFHEKEVKA